MKNLFKYSLVSLLSIYFLCAGLGTNVIRFCCNICEDVGIEEIVQVSCEEIHHKQHDVNANCCLQDDDSTAAKHETNCCDLFRLSVDKSVLALLQVVPQPTELESFVSLLLRQSYSEIFVSEIDLFYTHAPPITLSQGRIALSRNCVWII